MTISHRLDPRPLRARVPALCAVCVIITMTPLGALEWFAKELRLTPKSGESVLTGSITFRNAGEQSVRIVSIVPGCECTTAQAAAATYAPGERGEIRVEYAIGEKQGRHESTIAVTTEEPDRKLEVLTLRVNLPDVLSIDSRRAEWRVGEAATGKTITVSTTLSAGVKIAGLRSSDARVVAKLEKGADGGYRIVVTPTDTTQSMQAVVIFQAEAGGKVRSEAIQVLVR
jgi:hypothetical protein